MWGFNICFVFSLDKLLKINAVVGDLRHYNTRVTTQEEIGV